MQHHKGGMCPMCGMHHMGPCRGPAMHHKKMHHKGKPCHKCGMHHMGPCPGGGMYEMTPEMWEHKKKMMMKHKGMSHKQWEAKKKKWMEAKEAESQEA
jgi:hypothetical protein